MGQIKIMTQDRHIKISEIARQSGLTKRTLHYYEEIGLLVPGRSAKGYRLYSPDAVLRLQQILIQKSMGLPLESIKAVLDRSQIDQNAKMIKSIDAAIHDIEHQETDMSTHNILDGFNPEDYNSEVKSKWGESAAYQESARRNAQYSDDDKAAIKAELGAIWTDGADLMAKDIAPDSAAGRVIAARHRAHIERWFYPCSKAMHGRLADMWLADDRFRKNIDLYRAGLTDWLALAVKSS